MIIKPTITKKEEIIKQRMLNLLNSGREIDIEHFAKNINEPIATIDKLADEIIAQNSSHYEKISKTKKII